MMAFIMAKSTPFLYCVQLARFHYVPHIQIGIHLQKIIEFI